MIILRSLLFNIFFILWTLSVSILFSPLLLFKPLSFLPPRLWCKGTILGLKYLTKITHEVKGQENIHQGGYIYAVRHQSAWETVIMYDLLNYPTYILKRELLLIPFFNLYIIFLKMIAVNRTAGASALKEMLKKVKLSLSENRSIVIYPEGTRTLFNSQVKVQPGMTALYHHKLAPVIPVALNSGLYWPKNSFLKYPGKIIIEFLPPAPENLEKKEFNNYLSQTLTENTFKLEDHHA